MSKGLAYQDWRERSVTAAALTLADGGGTFDAQTLEPVYPIDGYAVGVEGLGKGSGALAAVDYIADRLREATISRHPIPYLGTWVTHSSYGHAIVWIDRVVIIPDRASALALARAFGERAVYDFAAGESVDVAP